MLSIPGDVGEAELAAGEFVDFIDLPAGPGTPATVTVGSSVTDIIEVGGDVDWIAINIVAGQHYTITLNGSGMTPLGDPFLSLVDASGTVLAFDDDGGPGNSSQINYTATTTGTFYVSVRGYSSSYVGGYTVEVSAAAPLPVYSAAQVASYLSDGYWEATGRSRHAFNTGTITYNVDDLTPEGRALAIQAFATWAAVSGLTFQQVSGTAQIMLDDSQAGAYATYVGSGAVTLSASVNVATNWLTSYGTGFNTYSFQTFIHEIGHVLGLGHAGNYNGSAGWSAVTGGDNHFINDSWQMSIMSYFSQDENTYVNATQAYVIGPMIADILAIQSLYGVSATVQTGNTTYGFNNTSLSVHNFANYSQGSMVAFAIYDSAGIDTLDASGFSSNQVINLTPGTYSDIGGETGNIGIAFGVHIENAVGGSGHDQITGNVASNMLWGNSGNDTIFAGQGDDFLYGGLNNDVLNAGRGSDQLYGGQGDDILNGGAGADSLLGGLGFDTVDYIDAGAGITASLLTPAGNTGHAAGDTYDGIEGINGSNFSDILTGNSVDNVITARQGDDFIYGGLGNDSLLGNAGNDSLFGGQGNDQLTGGLGNDSLGGGLGSDTFIFASGFGSDAISDFAAGSGVLDLIQLSVGALYDTFAEVMATAQDISGNTVFVLGGDVITVIGRHSSNFAADDFAFV